MAASRVVTDRRSIKRIVRLYVNGSSLSEIASEYGVAVTTIRNYLLAEGVEMRPRGGRAS